MAFLHKINVVFMGYFAIINGAGEEKFIATLIFH